MNQFLHFFIRMAISCFVILKIEASNQTEESFSSLLNMDLPPYFVETSFWESMSWQHPETDNQIFKARIFEVIEKKFEGFCKEIKNPERDKNFAIPRMIHFIWLGSPLPSKFHRFIQTWEKHHPDWELKIWTDADVENFSWFSKHSQLVFDQAISWAEKSDILRYEILYQFGGIYSDTDVICFKPFDDLISTGVEFFACQETNQFYKFHGMPLYLGQAVFGCRKGSPILKYCIENFRTAEEACEFSSPSLGVIIRGGPCLFSRGCFEMLSTSKEKMLILPCSYFYPLPFHKREQTIQEIANCIRPESFAIHLWEMSWDKQYE